MPDPADAASRPWYRVLTDGVFGRYMLGNVTTLVGIWVFNVVAVVVAWEVSGSALVAGAVTAAQFLPQLLLAPLSGAAADRWNRRRQVALGQTVAMTGAGGMALWAAVGTEIAPWHLVVASAVVGIGNTTAGPPMLALIPSLVRERELHTAVSLGMLPLPLGRAVGPVLGTTLALTLSPAAAFAVTAATNGVFLLLLRGVRPIREVAVDQEAAQGGGVLALLRRRPALVLVLVAVGAAGVGTDPSITLAPALSAELGHGSRLAGPMASAFGIGAGLGFALVPWSRRRLGTRRYGFAGLVVLAGGMTLAAFAPAAGAGRGAGVGPGAGVALAGLGLAGVGLTLAMTGLSATLQMSVPEVLRGRVMALWSVAFVGTRPVAALANGAVADAVSVPAALAGVALVAAAAGAGGLLLGGQAEARAAAGPERGATGVTG